MADSRRDPQYGDLLTSGKEMIAVTGREGNLVTYILRLANGAEINGACALDKWFEVTQDATAAGKVDIQRFSA